MNEPQLLIEHWGQPGEIIDGVPMLESYDGKDTGLAPGLYIEGIFMQAEKVNRNKRLYPKKILEKAVANYMAEQVVTKQALGELNHPPRANVDPMQAAIIIEDMWWKGNDVYGRARIIEGDHGPGDKLAANIRAGWIPGVSSRGLGSLTETNKGYKLVNEGYRLTVGVDAVWGPSAPDAYVKPKQINESAENTSDTSADDAYLALAEAMKAL
ncbi:MAG: prohead assembly (scaffolding) protein [Enterobacter phage ENC9]|uniref:Prohead core scaffold protein and protease n=2 Tax=Kanagawavirus TaxID=2843399 RepID=A0A6B9XZQ7_9CAUD|nr:prohead core scaffolding protein and protease [Enterobacter phage vB_EclM_CIP9]YP_010650434.1 head maturation protease [Enterobacter phage vB_EhoM-IME523]YP_010650734.1 head maturation protease [Enterobacter phage vB_EclM_Q7622]UIW11215.1 MAG: prohead assembly (scaffolding) protein [Enterobacter phage ENC9]UTY64422.1 prohead core scaffolding protein and protease [Enterobacter phage Entb_45]QEA10662.1 prohead core protein and protease [Enterobacter phage vB_EhoM-IME523]QHS01830.1 prohead co